MGEIVGPGHLRRTAIACRFFFEPLSHMDWSRSANDLGWSCRQALDHISNTLVFYAAHLASEATSLLPRIRDGAEAATLPMLLISLETTAAILARVVEASPPTTRAFHPAGMADPSGFAAMGCDELLIHTNDIGKGLGARFAPPEDVCRAVLERLFPWAPEGLEAWETLLWANGRGELPGVARQDENWYWHCAPLEEWDGKIARRKAPPGWS